MKQWFPFTDYDFYAYLTCGIILIGGWDFVFGNNVIIYSKEWTVPQIFIYTVMSYLLGQIAAGPSSAILEHLVMHRLFSSPSIILLGLAKRSKIENIFANLFANREYKVLDKVIREPILETASAKLGHKPHRKDADGVFQLAFIAARQNQDIQNRMDQFRNLYGFSRNVSFCSFVVVTLAFGAYVGGHKFANQINIIIAFLIIGVGMFGRFLKFYSAFALEVFRGYGLEIQSSSKNSEYSSGLAADQPSRSGAL